MLSKTRSTLLCVAGLVALGTHTTVAKPILVSTPNSTRAIALDAVTFKSEPFSPTASSLLYGAGQSTRIIVFVLNLSLLSSENADAISGDAEDASNHHFLLTVEYFQRVPGQQWLSMAVLKLDPAIGDAGDVLLQLSYAGSKSNRVRIGIGHLGGGPPDDPGSGPTPAPPYILTGRVLVGGLPLSGAIITLAGDSPAAAIANEKGLFSFTVTTVGDYMLTATQKYYTFTPATVSFATLAASQSVNFMAVRDTYLIAGQLKNDEGAGVAGVQLNLESSAGGSGPTTTTAGDGTFSFTSVPAGFDYKITPAATALFNFTPAVISELKQNLVLNFTGTRREYSISGRLIDKSQSPVAGATVVLTGAATASTASDASGNYSFTHLPAGRAYTVSATKTDHFVNPTNQTFTLLRDEQANFSAIRYFIISGIVTTAGRPLRAIIMSLSGPETGIMRTKVDGSYSFTVTTSGNYVLTPSREQDFYRFTPAQPAFSVNDHVTLNFTAAIDVTGPTYVLEFDGTQKTVDYFVFWPSDTNVGHFFWELWAMPGTDTYTRYMLSDGYGGAHALLFGFNYGPSNHYNLFGNVWVGSDVLYFNSDDGPSPGEWGHYAVGWDGKSIITYYDGVPVGKQAFTGPRVSTGFYNGATLLLMGGSDHQNLIGRIAQVRGYEENNPHENSPEAPFQPETLFSADGQLVSYYLHPSTTVTDLSNGYRGALHDGWPRGFTQFYFNGCDGCPAPQFVLDPSAPSFSNSTNPGTVTTAVDAPALAPGGALVFDSFSRNNATYVLNGKGGLGVTETGARSWQTSVDSSQPQPFGILSAHAVVLANDSSVAWVTPSTASANLEVRVSRTAGQFGSGVNTGLSFRVVDRDNFWFAYTHDNPADPSGAKQLAVGFVQGGVKSLIADGIAVPSSWKTLRAVTRSSGVITVYIDDSQMFSQSSSLDAAANGAGLFNFGPGMGLENRWDDFTVFPAP